MFVLFQCLFYLVNNVLRISLPFYNFELPNTVGATIFHIIKNEVSCYSMPVK